MVHFASGPGSTGAGVTRVGPLDTPLTLADVSGVAVIINDALGAAAGDCVWLGNQPGLTLADGVVVRAHPARGSRSAGRRVAGVGLLDALLTLANVAGATISIDDALWSTSCDCVRFGNVSGQAVANWVASTVDLTGGSWTTGAGIAGVGLLHTLLIAADVAIATVGVNLALRSAAGDGVWLWDKSGKAVTNRVSCPVRLTGGARSTGGGVARIGFLHTPVALAHLSVGTVWVGVALVVAASDGVRLGNEPGLALADGIAVDIDGAGGVRAARMWEAGVLARESPMKT